MSQYASQSGARQESRMERQASIVTVRRLLRVLDRELAAIAADDKRANESENAAA